MAERERLSTPALNRAAELARDLLREKGLTEPQIDVMLDRPRARDIEPAQPPDNSEQT